MKKYCLIGKVVCNFTEYVLSTSAIVLTGVLVIIKTFLG